MFFGNSMHIGLCLSQFLTVGHLCLLSLVSVLADKILRVTGDGTFCSGFGMLGYGSKGDGCHKSGPSHKTQ
ncbi:hypothetical protein F0562_034242 [Nyssa sinensis]|uniref:Uncharacterized protein n=1 Tax=Nyssa sinensis TaxID=561372 RepID=A0A5J5AHN7_9ASTE|nr:hypothetical protein F0562_034242 [Nyssa sinensis]